MNSERFLITTALQENWVDDQPVLFLGEWCKIYSQKASWENLDSSIVPYVWDDRKKYYSDYQYLNGLYERLLPLLAKKLNSIHNTEYDFRYWRIVVGPWLNIFIQIVYERWEQINKAQESNRISGTFITNLIYENYVPVDMNGFANFFVSDYWNHFIYSYIIKGYTDIKFMEKEFIKEFIKEDSKTIYREKGNFLKKLIHLALSKFNRKKNSVILEVSFSNWNYLKLLFRYGYHCQNFENNDTCEELKFDYQKRDWVLYSETSNQFESCLISLLPLQIPLAYLEGFQKMRILSSRIGLPKKPSKIITSNVYYHEVFKFWIAEKIVNGSKLFVVQHGGTYGSAKWFTNETHEISIADHFISWGWGNKVQSKIIPAGMFKKNPFVKRTSFNQKNILLVVGGLPRYSYKLWSETVSSQWLTYFNEQCAFINYLPSNIQSVLKVRLYPKDFGWNEQQRFKDNFPNVVFPLNTTPISTLSTECKIIVSTYNSTTFLETLAKNIPTVVFWNSDFWELRVEAMPYFSILKEAGIFHESPESAANHVHQVWDNIESWWLSVDVQNAKKIFIDQFAAQSNNMAKIFCKLIEAELPIV
jgi:putative transferase (TIGR04331 family)